MYLNPFLITYFLTHSGSVRQEKLNIKNLPIKYIVIAMTPDKRNEFADSLKNELF
jgi:hypothetical protein